jgi:lysophospholipase L1-like esterase
VFSKNRLIDANHTIKELADEYSLKYIDLFSLYADQDNELPQELTIDGVHLYLSAYKRWSDALRNYLE